MTRRWVLAALVAWGPWSGCATGHAETSTPSDDDTVESTVSDTRAGEDEADDTAEDTVASDDEAEDTRASDEETEDTASSDTVAVEAQENTMKLQIGERALTATLVDNSSTRALKALLAQGPLTIAMEDYGNMEKVGSLGTTLPRNDEQITTEAGDLILYQGSAFVIYYAPNSWNFTRLGKVDGVTAAELKAVLGPGDVSVTLSLE